MYQLISAAGLRYIDQLDNNIEVNFLVLAKTGVAKAWISHNDKSVLLRANVSNALFSNHLFEFLSLLSLLVGKDILMVTVGGFSDLAPESAACSSFDSCSFSFSSTEADLIRSKSPPKVRGDVGDADVGSIFSSGESFFSG